MSIDDRSPEQWRTGLPPFNRLVLAYMVGSKDHTGMHWHRDGFAFMVRHDDVAHTVADKWASDRYSRALKEIDADHLEVTHWMPLERPR